MTPPDEPGLDHDHLRALCDEATGLIKHLTGPVSKVSIRAGEYQVDVEWDPTRTASVAVGGAAPVAVGAEPEAAGPPADDDRPAVLALLVGTFYRSPEPGASAFVEIGDIVEAGQDVAIVEAMKMMNRVQTEHAGRVAEILVEDGDMVEFEQRLIIIEPIEEDEG
jgi:acetyl-CoA carboxylase biotin carboxyl carrier protein